jgi:hypothetical protein
MDEGPLAQATNASHDTFDSGAVTQGIEMSKARETRSH